jgi:hypothetical protein
MKSAITNVSWIEMWMETTSVETLPITFNGTCDLAMWCKLLRDKGWSGPRIARALNRSEGYVNNLIRVVERASPNLLVRWREEQGVTNGNVCATDWLVQICLLPHDKQDQELARRLAAAAGVTQGLAKGTLPPADEPAR